MTYYAMERGWQDHHIFEDDEYSRRDAWEWMIGEASWQDTKKRINGTTVTLKRGQFSHSFRFMAEKWGWSLGKTQRFINALKNESMIDTQSDTGQAVITICNYEKYQKPLKKQNTQKDTQSDTGAIQERYKEEEVIESSSEAKASSEEAIRSLPSWHAFVQMRKASKKLPFTPQAEKLAIGELLKFQAAGHDPTAILNKSILRGWAGLFAPDEPPGNSKKFKSWTS